MKDIIEPNPVAVTERPAAGTARLKISEIFYSLQGEAAATGWPTVFVRLTGCPLRCVWCDTAYAFHGGQWRTFDEIVEQVAGFGASHVCVTGGEPLAQPRVTALLSRLCDLGYHVSLETSGALPLATVDPRVVKVVDVKAPDSGEAQRNLWENLACLGPGDQLKFVLASRRDYEWARCQVTEHGLAALAEVWFSPVWQTLPAAELADWILTDRLPVRLQVQLHKILWGEGPGR